MVEGKTTAVMHYAEPGVFTGGDETSVGEPCFFKASDFGLIASVVLKITIPCAVVSYFSKITPDFTLFWLVVLGIVCNLIPIFLGWMVGFAGGRRDQAFNMINFSGYNIGCFALPLIEMPRGNLRL